MVLLLTRSGRSLWRRKCHGDRRWPRLRGRTRPVRRPGVAACRPRRLSIPWARRRRATPLERRASGPWQRCRGRGGRRSFAPRMAAWV